MLQATRERRYAVILLGISAAVLAAGTYIRSRRSPPKPPSETVDLEGLQRLTGERRLRDLSAFLADAAAVPARSLVSLAGLAWDSTIVIASPAPIDRTVAAAVGSDGHPVALSRFPSHRFISFSVWKASADAGLPRASVGHARPGDWVLAVARDHAGKPVFAHGIYQGI